MIAIGLDLGTTSISAAAIGEDGRLVGSVARAHRADVAGLPGGHAEQSQDTIFRAAVEALAELRPKLNEPVACLGLTGQMHSVLLADGALRATENLVTWQDKRALEATGHATWLEAFRALCDPAAVARTGCIPSPGYLAVTLFTLMGQGRVPAEAEHALILADWAAAVLTGTTPVTDRTNAASTGVFDLERDEWSELIEATGLPREMFARVVESGTAVGGMTAEWAEATGLPEGLPVSSAIGDHQAAVLGSLPAGEAAVQVNIGTGGQVSLPVPRFLRTPTSDTRYLPDGKYLLVGAGMAGGDAYAWVRRTIGAWLEAFGAERSDDELFARLTELASAVPAGCHGLRCEPFFRGTRREPNRRGVFAGVSGDNFTPGHVARAVLEGIAEALASFTREHAKLPEVADAFTRVIATGNAVRRNPLLAASLARAFGLPVFVPEHEEEAAYGAAVVAGVRNGMWGSLEEVGRRFRLIQVAAPDDTN